MSFTLHGIGVSSGVAIGRAHLVSHARLEVAHYVVPPGQVEEEIARFDAAVARVRTDLETLRDQAPVGAPAEFAAFINLHLMILSDTLLATVPREIIAAEQCNAEWAVKVQMDELLARFNEIEDAYLRERRADVLQVVERIMKALTGQPGYVPPPSNNGTQALVLVARDLSPADVVQF
ncbi:MAG TPA: phosphoenolpyruvate-utilizing N-terminal domain-containing protein, partial [Burkholderiales bacterium]